MLIRCSACRGTKQVIKLGILTGECRSCEGSGVMSKKIDKIETSEKYADKMHMRGSDDKAKRSK